MSEKIKWYREVLTLEPNSKVFFPLARMLADENSVDEAIEVLRHGLERHKEFLEARLFLIELLFTSGKQDACSEEIENLNKMFSIYAGFWQAWATVASVKNSSDVATIIRLLAASFQNTSLTLHEVIEKGLGHCAMETHCPLSPVTSSVMTSATNDVDVQEQIDIIVHPTLETDASEENSEPMAEEEEHFTLRTRSMAEVLAEQGDIKGALEIYQELLISAPSEEQADLNQRIAGLRAHLASPEQISPQTTLSVGKDKLINMLETLAARVEARAQN